MQVTCEGCQTLFDKNPSQIIRTKANFCSRACANKTNNKRRAEAGYTSKGKTKEIICKDCGQSAAVAQNAMPVCSTCSKLKEKNRRARYRDNLKKKTATV